MFSITPRIGTWVFSNIETPRRTSISATSCGVETTTAPDRATRWARVSWMSPVPGGMSMTRTSSGSASLPQATSFSIWFSADEAIGPRQIIGAASSTNRPMDMTFSPWASSGCSLRSSPSSGSAWTPVMRGIEGP